MWMPMVCPCAISMKWKVFDAVRMVLYITVFLLLVLLPVSFFEERSFCVYYNLFGVRCPGCGTTRAVVNLLHGNFERAWMYNRLGVILAPALAAVIFHDMYRIVRRYSPGRLHSDRNSLIDWLFGRGKPIDR